MPYLQFYMYIVISAAGYYLIGASILFTILVAFFVVFFMKVKDKQNLLLLRQEKERINFQQNLLQTQLEIQEQTLKNISQEVHDNIGQVLTLAKLNLSTVDLTNAADLIEKITDSKQLVSKAINDLRDLSKSLNTDNVTTWGLIKSIQYQLELIKKNGYETKLVVEGDIIKLEPQKELIIFRIVQEILNNILKHAEAKKIIVHANYFVTSFELLILDDGKGFDIFEIENDATRGLGIKNMQNRAKLVNASFQLSSTIGSGTILQLTIPY